MLIVMAIVININSIKVRFSNFPLRIGYKETKEWYIDTKSNNSFFMNYIELYT